MTAKNANARAGNAGGAAEALATADLSYRVTQDRKPQPAANP
jgi:hypothetical protein